MAFKTYGYVMYALSNGAIPFNLGMVLSVVVITAYILYGGQRSVVVTDFLQGLISCVIVVVGLVFVAHRLFGGYGQLLQDTFRENAQLFLVGDSTYWACIIIGGSLGAYCWLEIFNRIFMARSVKDVRNVVVGAPIVVVIFSTLLMMLSYGGIFIPKVMADVESGFLIMFRMAGGPLLLAAAAVIIIAADMSNTDSALVTNSTVIAKNVVGALRSLTDAQLVMTARVVAVIYMAAGLIVAMTDLPILAFIAIWTYECLLQGFAVIILGALWSRGTLKGAVAAMAVGLPVTLALMALPDLSARLLGSWTPGVVGFVVNMVVYVGIALATPPDKRVEELFNEIRVVHRTALVTGD
jgi:SSS family solute:Na+ symporter